MAMQRAEDAVSELSLDISDKQKVLDATLHLMKTYPDLKIERDGRITSLSFTKFSSSAANAVSDGVDITQRVEIEWLDYVGEVKNETTHIDASPYTTVEGYKVYSDPPVFSLGTVVKSGFGVTPVSGWEDTMEEAGIGRDAIRAAKDYLRKNPPIDYSLDTTETK